jgi:hypothetical protein
MTQSVHRHEHLLSTVAEVRTVLCFRVPESALREWLPPEWKAVPDTDGAHAGANLRLPLTDQQMVLDADGMPRPAARFAPLVVPAMRDGMDVPAPMVIAVLTAHVGEGNYDPYGNAILAKGEVRRCSTTGADAITPPCPGRAGRFGSTREQAGAQAHRNCRSHSARREARLFHLREFVGIAINPSEMRPLTIVAIAYGTNKFNPFRFHFDFRFLNVIYEKPDDWASRKMLVVITVFAFIFL